MGDEDDIGGDVVDTEDGYVIAGPTSPTRAVKSFLSRPI